MYKVTATVFMIVAATIPCASADDIDDVLKLRDTKNILPLSQILEKIGSAFPGTLLDVDLENEHGKIIYEMEILSHEHRIQHLKVDAKTGKILIEDDD